MAEFNPQQHMTKIKRYDKKLAAYVEDDYLDVKWRIVWFRLVHPNGSIDSTPHILSDTVAIVKTVICDEQGDLLATGMATVRSADSDKVSWSGRDFEKAETAAIGRALGHAGFGTQFTGEDEGDYLADSPVDTHALQRQASPNGHHPESKSWADKIKELTREMYIDKNGEFSTFHQKGSLNKALEDGLISKDMSPEKAAVIILMYRAEKNYGFDTEDVQAILDSTVNDYLKKGKTINDIWAEIRNEWLAQEQAKESA